jgi:hypothetical protein
MGKRQDKRIASHKTKAIAQRTKPDKNEIITYHDWRMTRWTAAAIKAMEEILGYEVTLLQGPFNKGVGASAGTHDLDAVIDLSPYQSTKKVTVARRHSWAMWPRKEQPGVWGAHCHGVLKGPRNVAELALWQLNTAYPNHWDGLSGNNTDSFPVHPKLVAFNYDEWWHDGLLDDRIRGLTATINKLVDQLSAKRALRKKLKAQKKK